jgi:hypothetical protein
MYHSGVQRTRGGRHGYSPVKQRSNSVEKYPIIQPPNISAVMAAAVAASLQNNSRDSSEDIMNNHRQDQSFEPTDIVSVSMSPPSSEHNESDEQLLILQQQQEPPQLWDQFASENVRNEVELLQSRTSIAETLLSEKTKQLDVAQRQVTMLKQHLLQADQLNKEQAITIESLNRRLNGRNNGYHNSSSATIERVDHESSPSRSNGSSSRIRLPMVFENGGVTITPVVTSSSPPGSIQVSNSNNSKNLLSHLLRDGSSKGDMATIEPIRESSRINMS